MTAFLFLLVLAAIAGVLGAVLKVVAVIVLSLIAGLFLMGWLAWRSVRGSLERAGARSPLGSTRITIGRVRRGSPDDPPERDDRY